MAIARNVKSLGLIIIAVMMAAGQALAQPAAPATTPAADNPVIMTINGEPITKADYQNFVNSIISMHVQQMQSQGMPISPRTVEIIQNQILAEAGDQLLKKTVFEQAVEAELAKVKDEDIDKRIAEIRDRLKRAGKNLEAELASDQLTIEDLKRDVKKFFASYAVVSSQTGSLEPAEEDIMKFYEERKNVPEKIEVQRILLGFESDPATGDPQPPTDEAKAELRRKAEEALARLKKGEDFAKVAQEVSTDRYSAANGGKLGYMSREQEEAPKEFREAAWKLKVGEFSDVIETDYGYQIIRVNDHKKATTLNYNDVKGEIHDALLAEKFKNNLTAAVEKLAANAKVEKTEAYDKVVIVPAADDAATSPGAPPAAPAE